MTGYQRVEFVTTLVSYLYLCALALALGLAIRKVIGLARGWRFEP